MIIWHCQSQLKNVDSSGIWTHTFGMPVRRSTCWAIEPTGIGGEFIIQLKCTRYSRNNLTLIHERMCSVSILFQNYPQLTSGVSDYHENFQFMFLWGWFWNRKYSYSFFRMKNSNLWLASFTFPLRLLKIAVVSIWISEVAILNLNYSCKFSVA